MEDDRTYIRVHDGLPDHPKVEPLSDAAFRLLMSVWCWCSRHLTDGHIPAAVWVKRGTAKTRRELIAAGLVEEVPSGVSMHDYLEHQRSAAEVNELKEAKSTGGSWGNHVRWHVKKGRVKPDCEHCQSPNGAESGSQEGSDHRSDSDRTTDPDQIAPPIGVPIAKASLSVASTETDTETEKKPKNERADARSRPKIKSERGDVERLCQHLADLVEANGSRRPAITDRWRDAARLLIDRDGRTETQVRTAIDWCQGHEFWRSNVLSMPKLREKYDQMRLQAQRDSAVAPASPRNGSQIRPGNPYLNDLRDEHGTAAVNDLIATLARTEPTTTPAAGRAPLRVIEGTAS